MISYFANLLVMKFYAQQIAEWDEKRENGTFAGRI